MALPVSDNPSKDNFGLVVMWLLFVAFLIAVPFMFVHPFITLLLFFSGLLLLAVASFVWKLLP
jgi:hypothetical protein